MNIADFTTHPFTKLDKEWAILTAGVEGDYNSMTVSWGGMGTMWGKPVLFLVVKPLRYTFEFLSRHEELTLSFYDEQYKKALGLFGSKSGRDTDKAKETGFTPKTLANGVTYEEAKETQEKKISAVRFVFNPRVISFFVFMLIPLLIGGYFLYYMFPIIGSEWGLSDTYIGYAYVLNGLFAAILGKMTTEFFSRGRLKPFGLLLATAMYAGAFSLVMLNQTILSLLAALVIMGIADSFGIPLLTNYYTDIKAVEEYGYDRALGVYSLFENGAQSLGSFVFGIVLTVGVADGLKTMIIVMAILAVCFLLSVLFCMKKEKKTVGQ